VFRRQYLISLCLLQACEGSKGNWGLLHNTCQVLITWLTNERWCWTANSVICLYVCSFAIFGGLELDCIQLLISFLFSYSIAIIFLGSRTNNGSGWSFTSFTTFMYIIISISIFFWVYQILFIGTFQVVAYGFLFSFFVLLVLFASMADLHVSNGWSDLFLDFLLLHLLWEIDASRCTSVPLLLF